MVLDDYDFTGQELFRSSRIKIHVSSQDPESHEAALQNDGSTTYLFLQRGVLKEMSRADRDRIRNIYRNIRSEYQYEIENPEIPFSDFVDALRIAGINELESKYSDALLEVNTLSQENSTLRTNQSALIETIHAL